MPSKSRKMLNKNHGSLGLGTPHSKSREREAPNHRTKGRENIDNNKTTSLSHKK
jgi:hypothetical protein